MPGDDALDHLAFEGFVFAAEAFVEQGREIVAGRKCRCRHEEEFSHNIRFGRVAGDGQLSSADLVKPVLPRKHHASRGIR